MPPSSLSRFFPPFHLDIWRLVLLNCSDQTLARLASTSRYLHGLVSPVLWRTLTLETHVSLLHPVSVHLPSLILSQDAWVRKVYNNAALVRQHTKSLIAFCKPPMIRCQHDTPEWKDRRRAFSHAPLPLRSLDLARDMGSLLDTDFHLQFPASTIRLRPPSRLLGPPRPGHPPTPAYGHHWSFTAIAQELSDPRWHLRSTTKALVFINVIPLKRSDFTTLYPSYLLLPLRPPFIEIRLHHHLHLDDWDRTWGRFWDSIVAEWPELAGLRLRWESAVQVRLALSDWQIWI